MDISVQVNFYSTINKTFGINSVQIVSKNPLGVRSLLEKICTSPERHEQIFDTSNCLRGRIIILKNGRNINSLNGLETELNNGDKVAIFPAVSGG